jgi:hypothetical protein
MGVELVLRSEVGTFTEGVPERVPKVCVTSEDAFVITCVANLNEVKVLYVQQDLRYGISSYWRFSV